MNTSHSHPRRSPLGPARAVAALVVAAAAATKFLLQRAGGGLAETLVDRPARNLANARANGLVTDDRELGNVITDNLGMIVFGILAIVVIGGLISGLGTSVVNWVTKQLGV